MMLYEMQKDCTLALINTPGLYWIHDVLQSDSVATSHCHVQRLPVLQVLYLRTAQQAPDTLKHITCLVEMVEV